MKTIIFITGVSTVGKSSLAHILGSKLFMPRNFAIPLTIANPRKVSLRHTAAVSQHRFR
ncbi:hypothetical protein WPAUFG295_00450 [Wolbachia pipientis]|jgi:adenylylsulfate kinase-like enzyme